MPAHQSPPAACSDATQRASLYRRLEVTRWNGTTRTWRNSWTYPFAAPVTASALLLPALFLELRLGPWPFEPFETTFLDNVPTAVVLVVLAGCWPLNALLVERQLRHRDTASRPPRAWVRIVRRMLGGLPLMGILVSIPAWSAFAARAPRWAFQRATSEPLFRLGTATPPAARPTLDLVSIERCLRRFEESILWAVWLFGVNVFVLMAITLWLGRPTPTPIPPGAAIGMWACLHLGAAAAATTYARREAQRLHGLPALFLRLVPVLFLLPYSFFLLSLFLVAWTDKAKQETLVRAAFRDHANTGRLVSWQRFRRRVASDWKKRPLWAQFGRTRPTEQLTRKVRVERHLHSLYRLKTAALFFDGACLALVLASIREAFPTVTALVTTLETATIWVLAVLSGAALLWSTVDLAKALAGNASTRAARRATPSCSWYLATGALVAIAGTLFGRHHQAASATEAGLLIASTAALGATVTGMYMMVAPMVARRYRAPHAGRAVALWSLLLLVITALGGMMALLPRVAEDARLLALAATLTSPLWQVAIGVWFLPWSLYPLSLADLRAVPPPSRSALSFLASTVLLPWGGLAIPIWAAIRRRHQLAMDETWIKRTGHTPRTSPSRGIFP